MNVLFPARGDILMIRFRYEDDAGKGNIEPAGIIYHEKAIEHPMAGRRKLLKSAVNREMPTIFIREDDIMIKRTFAVP
jgi:hypothetical protein